MPLRGRANSQLPAWRPANWPSCPAHAPLAAVPTNQQSPSCGEAGGALAVPTIAGWSNISVRAWASLTNTSFCACPASVAVLRAAQAFRLSRRIEEGLRAVWPAEPPQGRFKHRTGVVAGAGQNAAFAFNHHRTCLANRRSDQRDARLRIGARHHIHPFRPRPRLAETAPGADQPQPPVTRWGQLFGAGPERPVAQQFAALRVLQFAQQVVLAWAGVIQQPAPVIIRRHGDRVHHRPAARQFRPRGCASGQAWR